MNEVTDSDMLGLMAVLNKWRRPILMLVFIATVIASVVALLVPKQYSSTAVVFPVNSMLSDKSRLFNHNIQQLYSEYGGSDDLDHLYAIAVSNSVLRFIVDSFHLAEHYKIEGVPEKANDIAVKKLKKNVDFIKSENGELRIELWDQDNKLAADIANAILYKIQAISNEILAQSNMASIAALKKAQLHELSDRFSGPDSNQATASKESQRSKEALNYKEPQSTQGSQPQNPKETAETAGSSTFIKEIQELEISSSGAPPAFVVLEKPAPSVEPGKPKILMIIIGTFLLSTFFAILAALVIERSK